MADRTTTRSRPYSKPSRARFAWPVHATSSWARCCLRQKDCSNHPSEQRVLAVDPGVLMRVTVIDYKAGNLTSVLKALRHLGAEPEVTDGDLALLEPAERVI